MAIRRSVVQIDVQDEKWKEYMTSFTKYNTMLSQQSGVWKKTAESSKTQLETMQFLTASLLANADAMRKVAANQNDMTNKSKMMAASWKEIVKSTKESAVNTYQQVTHLLRASGIIAAVTGLATGVGIFGLDRLAASASNDRRTALGLGVPTGRSAAFNVGFGRAIDTSGFLQGVARARGSMTSNAATAMRIMGMNPRGKGDAGDMSDELLERIRAIALKAKESGEYGLAVQTNRLEEFNVGERDLQRIGAYSPKEWKEFKDNENRAGEKLGMADSTQKRWEDFYVAMGLATDKLKTGLINGLEKLTPGLTKLTDKLSDFVLQFTASKGFAMVIEDAAKGLEWAAKYVSSDDFKNDLEGFGNSMKGLYQGLRDFVEFFSSPIWKAFKIANNIASAPAKMAGVTVGAAKNVYDWATGGGRTAAGGAYVGAGQPGAAGLDAFFGGTPGKSGGVGLPMPGALGKAGAAARGAAGANGAEVLSQDQIVKRMMDFGWSADQAYGIARNLMREGGGSTNPGGSNDGGLAYGMAQWHADDNHPGDATRGRQGDFYKLFGHPIQQSTGEEQLKFIDWELRHGQGGDRLAAARDKVAAEKAFYEGFERPRDAWSGPYGGVAPIGGQRGGADAHGVTVRVENNTGGSANPIISQMGLVPQ